MLIEVTVKPHSRGKECAKALPTGGYLVVTRAPAIDNKANLAAQKLLAKHFGVAKSQVQLVRGTKSREKVFEIFL